ncbi:MAG TPA: hypothetical protein VK737_01060 [Opitutales bacterium]|jgi:lipopolysaccharide biosynthesis regulator YciM|nr:hypothetical protein [Opitutales bacterium]
MAFGQQSAQAGNVDNDAPNPRKRWYIILAVLAVLAAVCALLARPVYHRFKHWRALQLVQASEQAMAEKNLQSAQEKANAALQLWPDDVRTVRQEAKVILISNPAGALPYWLDTWQLSNDLTDLRQAVDIAIATGNFPVAFANFEDLQQRDPNNPATWMLEGKIRLSQNQIPEALDDFKKVLASKNAPPDVHLYYARAAQLSSDPAERAAGLAHLQSLAQRTDDLGLQSLRALANYPELTLDDAITVADQLTAHPQANKQDKLTALQLRSRVPGADVDKLIQSARDLFPGDDADSLAAIGTWLVSQNQNQAVLKLIDESTAMKRQDLFLIRTGAMAGLGQWTEIDNLLNRTDPRPPIPNELKQLFEARTLSAQGQTRAAEYAWQNIRNAVADQPIKLYNVAQYAAQLGLDDVARPAFEQLANNPEFRRAALTALVQLEHHVRDTATLRKVLEQLGKYYPDDSVVQNDLLYVGFLLGDTGPEKIAAARALQAKNPTYLANRMTLALGLLLAKQPADALKALADVKDSTWPLAYEHDQGNDWNAVYVGLMRANGQLDRANQITAAVHADELLPEEAALLNYPLPTGTQAK